MTAGEYDDGTVGEVFIKMSKQGSTLAGVMDAFSISISIGLQYGVPLEAFVSKYINMRFELAGLTDDADVRMAQSVMDYIFRRLALDYLPLETRSGLGIFTAEERAATVSANYGSVAPAVGEELDVDVEGLQQGVPVDEAPLAAPPATVAEAKAGSTAELIEAQQAPQRTHRSASPAAPRCGRPAAATSAKAAAAPAAAAREWTDERRRNPKVRRRFRCQTLPLDRSHERRPKAS